MKISGEKEQKYIRAQLDRLFRSEDFKASEKQKSFLRFIAEEALEGRGSQLKGFTIAVEVYGRNERFDPRTDPIVRVEAGRLRRALELYYLKEGRNDPLRIRIPKGGYAPVFEPIEVKTATGASIAVLPFVDLTGEKGQEYFTNGLTEELTTELARYQNLKVIASQSTMRFKDREMNPGELGVELNVRFLLTGNVRRDSKTVKVSVQLLDASAGEQIWAESYRCEYTAAELIGIQEEIAQQAIGAIADQWGLIERRLSREAARKAPSELNAYEAVLRFYHYETELTVEAFEQALEALTYATEIEPGYGLAWSMLGHLHADNYALGFRDIEDTLDKALSYAKKGVAIAPENQFAWDALSVVYFQLGEKRRFLETIEKSLSLNPNSPYIVGVTGWHLMLFGEWDRGLELLRKGMRLNPLYPTWFHLATSMECYRRGGFRGRSRRGYEF